MAWLVCRARPITGTSTDAVVETADCELRDQLQRICLKHPFYGYRRVTATIRRKGMVINGKKVLKISCARIIFSRSARPHS